MPYDSADLDFFPDDSGIDSAPAKSGVVLSAFRAARHEITSIGKRTGAKTVLAVMMAAAAMLGTPHKADAQCYDYNSAGNASVSVNITNLPAPSTFSDGQGGTEYIYNLQALSGNTATVTQGTNSYLLTPPFSAFSIIIDDNPPMPFTTFTLNVGETTGGTAVTGIVLLKDTASHVLPGGWPVPNFPALADWNVYATVEAVVAGTTFGPYNLTAISNCGTPPPPPPKSLGDCGCNEPGSVGQTGSGDPINVATGNMFEEVADYKTAGQNPLGFTRYYNSMQTVSNPTTFATTLGANWRSNFDRYLNVASGSSVTAERADGQVVGFTLVGSTWTPDSDVDMQLTQAGATWTLTDHNDNVETYSVSGTKGTLQSIAQRNGYTQFLHYTGTQLMSVTDSYSTRQLSFTYTGGLLNTVTTPDGLVLTYGFTAAGGSNNLTSVAYSTSPGTNIAYQYTDAGLPFALTALIDEKGQTFGTWTYDDATGRATSSKRGGALNAELTTVNLNSDGTVTVTNALGVADTYTFSTLQGVPKVTQISRAATATTAAATRTFSYDPNGYLNAETDWDGNSTTYTNNTQGNPTVINYATNSPTVTYTVNITYDTSFPHLPHIVTAPGVTSSYGRDPANGNPLNRTDVDTTTTSIPYSTNGQSRETQWTWNATGEELSVQLPRTDAVAKTSFTYAADGALTQIQDPLGHLTKITAHTLGGLPKTIVDENNITIKLTYDLRLNLNTVVVDPLGINSKTTYAHDSANELTAVTLPDNSKLTYTYDAAHRLTKVADLLTNSTNYTLDALGDVTLTQVKVGSTVKYSHTITPDALGRVLDDVSNAGTTVYAYDPMNNVVSITPPSPSGVTTQTFDALNRLSTRTDPTPGGTTTRTYDSFNRPLSVQDANGNTTSYVNDGFGDRIQTASPDSGTTVFFFDPDKNLTKAQLPGSITKTYTFDALDRMLTATYTGDATLTVHNTYDEPTGHGFGVGKLTSATDQIGSLSLTWDKLGNLTNETRTPTGLTALTTAWTFDNANNVASITYPDGNVVTNTRDSMGKITSITSKPSGAGSATTIVSGVAYEPLPEFAATGAPPVTGLTFGNSVTGNYGYDQDYRPTTRVDSGTAAVQNLTYGYYANNSVHTITDAVNAANTQTLGYDNHDRLTSAVSGAGGYGTYGFTWDSVDNVKTQVINGTTTTYHYPATSNRMSSFVTGSTTDTVITSASGNITAIKIGSTFVEQLGYNKANELATAATASNTASYAFDEFGKRLKEVGSATSTSTFQYDDSKGMGPGTNLLTDTDGAGNSRVDYIYLNGTPIGSYQQSNNKFYFISTDRLGTPSAVTDTTQALQWTATYQPFGNTTTGASGIVQNLRLPGQEWDLESTLNHNGFRDYAATLTRFVQTDPIGLAGGMNTFQALNGNAFKYTDRRGLQYVETEPDQFEPWSNTIEPYNRLTEETESQWPEAVEEQQTAIDKFREAAMEPFTREGPACHGTPVKSAADLPQRPYTSDPPSTLGKPFGTIKAFP